MPESRDEILIKKLHRGVEMVKSNNGDVASFGIISSRDGVVVVQDDPKEKERSGNWDASKCKFPGGKVSIDGLVEKIEEKTGLKVLLVSEKPFFSLPVSNGYSDYTINWYLMEFVSGELYPGKGLISVGTLTLEEARKYLVNDSYVGTHTRAAKKFLNKMDHLKETGRYSECFPA